VTVVGGPSRVKSFLLGTLFGGLMGVFLNVRRRRAETTGLLHRAGDPPRAFEDAACQTARDGFS